MCNGNVMLGLLFSRDSLFACYGASTTVFTALNTQLEGRRYLHVMLNYYEALVLYHVLIQEGTSLTVTFVNTFWL